MSALSLLRSHCGYLVALYYPQLPKSISRSCIIAPTKSSCVRKGWTDMGQTGRTSALRTLIAFKVLALADDMSAVERQVGATLIDSFNRKTGQCDPSLDRVAILLGVHRRSVIRATSKLEARGLIRKIRHGGNSNRNKYE